MQAFPLYLRRLLFESGRFFALLSIGLAWSAVPYVAVFLRHDPRFLLPPSLLAFLSAVELPLIALTPALALFGIAIVSRLTFVGSRVDEVSAIAVCIVTGAALLLPTMITPSWDSTSVVLAIIALVGFTVTAFAFARRSWPLALFWVLLVALPLTLMFATTDTRTFDDPEMIAGMRVYVLWTFTLIAIHVASVIAFAWPSRTVSATT